MKKILILFFCIPIVCFSQKTYVPDDVFEEWLEDNNYGDGISYNDSVLTSNLLNITWMNISGRNIADLTGIEDALNVYDINAHDNNLTTVDFSNNLALTWVNLSQNNISQIDLSNNTLLRSLSLGYNPIEYIDVSSLVELSSLDLWGCDSLLTLDLSSNTGLEYLYVADCDTLSDLDLRNGYLVNLNYHVLYGNPNLTCISVSNLQVANSVLTNIDTWVSFDLNCSGLGCTDSIALNYDPYASIDDGSCIYCVYGCMDPIAPNYNSLATCDDGSCSSPTIYGCDDPNATNYNSNVTFNDGSCTYIKTYVPDDIFEAWLEANGYGDSIAFNDSVITSNLLNITWMNISGRNIADLTGIEDALNVYDINAHDNNLTTVDFSNNLALTWVNLSQNNISQIDLSNNTLLRSLSLGYNPIEYIDVSSLVELSSLDLWGCDSLLTLDLSSNTGLEYLYVADCDTLSDLDLCNTFIVNLNYHVLYGNPNLFSIGVYDMLIADSVLTNVDPWVSFDLGCVGGGCTDPNAINYDSTALFNDLTCIYLFYGCIDSLALNYDSLATVDDGSCTYSVYGCTDSTALNYDSLATIDDGSCLYCIYGCTNTNSLNYDSLATCDDGSCIIIIYGCTDSLALNYFPGANLDDGSCIYTGCTDSSALNYNPLATIDDGSCTYGSNCT
ncbi:hypothetical protein OA521_03940, partial [bacterium]|nr:hypothetical protein [bacterium]